MPHVEGREKGVVLLLVVAVVRVRRHRSAVRRIMVTVVRGLRGEMVEGGQCLIYREINTGIYLATRKWSGVRRINAGQPARCAGAGW